MPFEFIFASARDLSKDNLQQGDLLFRDSRLADSIRAAHSYYADAEDYSHFMVLTQSCDLVRRRGKCKSRYITIAAARPASTMVDRLVKKYQYGDFEFPLSVCDKQWESLVRDVVENLLHNTRDGFFFIPKGSHPAIDQNLCVFLPLSISLRIDHYESCLGSKIAQLSPIFQAKLGFMAGNLYSRVGTPDLEEKEDDPDAVKDIFYQDLLYRRTAWLSSAQLKELKHGLKAWKRANPNSEPNTEIARELLEGLPKHIDLVAKRAAQQLQQAGLIANQDLERARLTLRNDAAFKKLVEP